MNEEILRRLESFKREGERLLAFLSEKTQHAASRKDWGHAATDFLGSAILPHGTKRTGKQLAKGALSRQKTRLEREAADMADQWIKEIVLYLKQVTKMTKTITTRGNSSTLVNKFNSAKGAVTAQTKINRGLNALAQLQNYDLEYTKDLKEIIQKEKLEKTKTAKFKHLSDEAKKLLIEYPSELECFLGAIERMEKGGLDNNRQCLSSCRTCIEILVKMKSNRNKWTDGLKDIVPSKTRQKTIKETYNFLSAYGVHGKETPTEEDAISGLNLTISAIRLIRSKER